MSIKPKKVEIIFNKKNSKSLNGGYPQPASLSFYLGGVKDDAAEGTLYEACGYSTTNIDSDVLGHVQSGPIRIRVIDDVNASLEVPKGKMHINHSQSQITQITIGIAGKESDTVKCLPVVDMEVGSEIEVPLSSDGNEYLSITKRIRGES